MREDAVVIGRGTGGVDGDTDNQTTAALIVEDGDATKAIYYTPRIGGFQLGASFTPDSGDGNEAPLTGDENGDLENVIQGGANWTGALGGLDVGFHATGTLADVEDTPLVDGGDVQGWSFGGLTGFAGLDFAASYGHSDFDDSNEVDFVVLGVAYEFGPVGVGFHYEHDWVDGDPFFFSGEDLDDINIYVVSADVGILPGVVVKGDVSYNDADPGADEPGDETWAGVLAIQSDY
jgi:outer membrane protein OmpU